MSIYRDSEYSVSEEVATVHASHLEQLGEAGAWGTGAQRIAVAQEARQAGYDAGVLEVPAEPGGSSEAKLPEAARRFIRKLAVSPKDISKDDYDAVRRGGLGDAEYVEIVGIVSRLTDLDVFARGIGVPLRPLPEPRAGQPSRHRPEAAKQELAWVPSVPNPPEGGALADELYRGKPTPYIVRGLSLVPDEVRRLLELERVQYIPPRQILNLDAEVEGLLTRAQIEVIAGRVSAINECFF